MGQQQRNGLAVIAGLLDGLADEVGEIARAVCLSGALPDGPNNTAMNRDRFELVVEPAHAERREVRGDGVGAKLGMGDESKHRRLASVRRPPSPTF
jgi:hypothetical protein